MFRTYLFLGILTATLASVGAVGYASFFNKNLFDFSLALGNVSIVAACFVSAILMSIGAFFINKAMPKRGEIIFNFLLTSVTFLSILVPLKFQIPPVILAQITAVNFEGVEGFFPIFVIPMHFFPAMMWYSLRPLFFKNTTRGI
ncbi:MAG: hypothetical protein V4638_02910 [Bacteroidota bacterium]